MKMSDEMFEGKDYPTQWALNPSSYQNMNSDQVDWAALAQQWIKMKETAVPPAPPPPPIINNLQSSSLNDGGGEAPMDMDTKDDDIPPAPPAPNISGTDGWNQWNEWGNHWNHTSVGNTNWEWSGISEGTDGKPIGIPNIPDTTLIPPPAPTISSNNSTFANHCSQSTAIPPAPPTIPPSFGYNPMPLTQPPFNSQIPPAGFWSSDQQQHAAIPGTSIPIQPPFMKGGRQNSSRVPLVPTPANVLATTDMVTPRHRDVRDRTPEEELPVVLDTIRRRQLPAWIREGLEKMEREKQKAVERERQELLRKQELEARKKAEDQAREVLNPSKSKFDSDSEKEATEHELDDDNKSNNNSNGEKHIQKEIYEQNSPDIMRPRKSRFHDANSPVAHPHTPATREKSPDNPPVQAKSSSHQNKEELLQNLMLKVRRSLTEILLEVTNDEIGAVCKEVWKRSLSKGKNLVHASSNLAPVAQITRKLGLGIYGDSNSESEEDSSQNEHFQQPNIKEADSDDELKETLRRRQQAFRKTEAEIEARIALEEEQDDDDDDDEDDEERVKRRQGDDQDNNTKKNEDGWKDGDSMRDDSNAKDKSRVKRDNYMGNTSCLVTGDNEKDSSCDNEKKSSDGRRGSRATSSKMGASDGDRLGHSLSHDDDSSSSESASRSHSSKRPSRRRSSSSNKNSRGKKKSGKHRSSSRSRSRSRHKYSSRENSCESSRSRSTGKRTSSGNRLADKKHKSHQSQKSVDADKQYYKSGSRSSSRSESRLNSESRSRSHSRSRSRSKHKRSRTRSRSANSHRRRRSRDRRLRSRSKTRVRSHSRSRSRESRSRSGSRSRKRSRTSYGRKNSSTAAGRGLGKKRDTRSRSSERTRRSRSKSRSSRGYYRQHSHYRRDRDGKKSSHRYQD